MSRIIVLQGTPCSGKSTWRNAYMENQPIGSTVVVCRDDIRLELNNGIFTLKLEKEVRKLEKQRIIEGISSGLDVIIDATNLNPKTIARWNKLASKLNCEIIFEKFYVPYSVAMKRNRKRKAEGGLYIPKKVMLDFYQRYFPTTIYKEELEQTK